MDKEQIRSLIQNLNIVTETTFVPFSRSRNKDSKNLSLNYKITLSNTLQCNGKCILVIDYSMGVGHIPNYSHREDSVDYLNAVKATCESGKNYVAGYKNALHGSYKPIVPDLGDIWSCLTGDTDVLNYSSFEDWADSFDYDTDSRKAEKLYQECLKHALALNSALGYKTMEKLQEAFQDY